MQSQSDYIHTNDVPEFLEVHERRTMRSRNAKNVAQFRAANGLHIGVIPDSSKADLELHKRLLVEEVSEFAIAVNNNDPHEILDALGDIIYVAYGAALDCGYDVDAATTLIHEASIRKLDADGKPIIDETGKIRKPEGWLPPDLSGLVERTA